MTPSQSAGEDLRVKRTQKLILDALIELTIEKGFSSVTISDITKYARINRATFYRHYQDKFDLLDKYAQAVYELLDAPSEGVTRPSSKGATSQMAPGLVRMFEHIRSNARFYRVMLGRNGDPAFTEKIRQYIHKRIQRSLPAGLLNDETFLDLYLSYSSSASVGTVVWWLEHEMPYSPEEMAAISYQLGIANLNSLAGLAKAKNTG
jgi:AcrR family transcriptional regulator